MDEPLIIDHARPEQLSAAQRAFEIASILAAAIVRTQVSGHDATEPRKRPVRLAKNGDQSVHHNPSTNWSSL